MKRIAFILIIFFSFNVLASSNIVMDTNSHRILYQNNAYEKRLIASTTKIMTFVVAYEYAKDFLNVYVEAGNEILKMYGTSIYLSLHEKMLLRDLLYGLMLRSGNDAAIVIAYFVGGSEDGFVKLMNKKAKTLGMHNTIFHNPHGLDENTQNYSTAYDMALLSSYASKIPFYREVTSTKYYQAKTELKAFSWTNRNKMVFTYPNFTTGKTGYTPSAGRTLVSTAKKDDLELTIVTLDDDNHYETQRALYENMFQKYRNYLLLSKKTFSEMYPTMYIKKDLYYPLTLSEREKVETKLVLNDSDTNEIGEIVILLNNKEIIKEKVYFQEEKEKTEHQTIWKKLKKFFKKIF